MFMLPFIFVMVCGLLSESHSVEVFYCLFFLLNCPLCKTDTDEDLEHFLLHCPNFSSIRIKFFKVFYSFVENQKYGLKFMELSSSSKLGTSCVKTMMASF